MWRDVSWSETWSKGERGHPEQSCAGSQGSQSLAYFLKLYQGKEEYGGHARGSPIQGVGLGLAEMAESREEV